MRIEPLARPPDATVKVPGSKSYTNRALLCALLAEGTSTLTGALDSDDTRAMARAVEALGARVRWDGTTVTVEGTGGALRPGPLSLDVHQAGTAARFLAPVLVLGRGEYRLDGDEQLRRRPMGPMIEALRSLDVEVREEGEPGHLPIVVVGQGRRPPGPVKVAADVSSQFVSGLLLAGFDVEPEGVVVSAPYIRMTEHVRTTFGPAFAVEPDASAASYFWAAGALFEGGRVRVEGFDAPSLQGDLRLLDLLGEMGAVVDGTEVRGGGRLTGIDVDMSDCPDVAPTLAVVAAFAAGATSVRGIGFVRHHETDRIKAVVTELRRCGVEAEEHDDGFTVRGGTPHGATVCTYGDHRMAMSFAVLGLKVEGIELDDAGCVSKTFPDFFDVLEGLRR
ncbi:MAG TPA: 3-phosphoshikimate 1-carboxyvinyltransferase [Acidimicrobiales bacterium]|nr:3-phosphoshikimate 1-carboxyvinyltransferase [Acidimicrobiales bacterium]